MSKKIKKKKKPVTKSVAPKKCGQCSVCCTSLLIDTPELAKPAGTPCRHLAAISGCSIYERRPGVCMRWHCGWLELDGVPPQLRPDRSRVLIIINPQPGVSFQIQPIDDNSVTSLLDDDVLLFIRNATLTNLPVAISVPTKPGYCSYVQLIHRLVQDVMQDKSALRARIGELIRHASSQITAKKPEIIHVAAL